ncbi:MAG TPA: M24 family metallopeptidase [Anaerolineales bacterium]|nr:M24 family metallopeptidase [Anaerolineales bacterium]
MKSDLDALMKDRNMDAILVLGDAEHNPPMTYLVGGGHVAHAVLIKKVHEEPLLFCNVMERDEAAKSGLKTIPLRRAPIDEFIDHHTELFTSHGVGAGRVGVYGKTDVGQALVLLDSLRSAFPQVVFAGEPSGDSLFMHAMETKDENEVARIRKMGQVTVEVVGMVADYLTSLAVRDDEVLLKEDGSPLTIRHVKGKIALWLAERGAVDVEGCIFAIGRDAGIPHSVGNPDDVLSLGKTIVFDIFPGEAGGGYFYDFTRTWSLGYATPEAQELYDEVKSVYDKVIENIDLNARFKDYQQLVCDAFNKNGHKTPMHDEGVLTEGYVHSLGHGLGLNVHERPWSRHTAGDDNLLKPGVVVTIEPGLYYPEKGIGVRIEDSYWIRPDGKVELLAEYPYDFVLPMKKWKKA